MIVTITPNPSIDHTLHVDRLVPEVVHRASSATTEPSGKGVNVALALHRAGVAVQAVLPVGGVTGTRLCSHLDELGLTYRAVPVRGETRTNVTVVDAAGATTKVNEPGPTLAPDEVAALTADASGDGTDTWVVWAGSLPPGFTDADLATAVARGRRHGRTVAVDSSGEALRAALAGGPDEVPHLIKPNAEELAELTGRHLRAVGDVVEAASSVVRSGVETVLVSLGADGAVLVTADGAWHGRAAVSAVVNTVGAGDAFLAGYLAARDQPPTDRLASALQFGAAAVEQAGTLLLAPPSPRPVDVGPADDGRSLSAPGRPES